MKVYETYKEFDKEFLDDFVISSEFDEPKISTNIKDLNEDESRSSKEINKLLVAELNKYNEKLKQNNNEKIDENQEVAELKILSKNSNITNGCKSAGSSPRISIIKNDGRTRRLTVSKKSKCIITYN